MTAVVSIDLAYRDYSDFGITKLEDGPSGAVYELLLFPTGRARVPTPQNVADIVIRLCENAGVFVVLLDGPQGWKDPLNGLTWSRRCERTLNTPAKTGLPGKVKPANYLAFVDFSVRVFDAFQARGWQRFDPAAWRSGHPVVIESFPLAAWRSLQLPCLPAKKKANGVTIRAHLDRLVCAGLVAGEGPTPTHDQLQALVAGLGGLGVMAGAEHRYEVVGTAPFVLDHVWREGYIVNPTRARVRDPIAPLSSV